MQKNIWFIIVLQILLQVQVSAQVKHADPVVIKAKTPGTPAAVSVPVTLDELWGTLFVDVQLHRTLGDNKTFVDAIPKYDPTVILMKYTGEKTRLGDSLDLKLFLEQHFFLPETKSIKIDSAASLHQHLQQLWPLLTRKADTSRNYSSLLPLPKPYVVPGGRFREIYYWDSYFTMLGLAASNRYDLLENMLDNFAYLIRTYGHIPNGNRSYYLSRSQPPYFALMVQLLQQKKGDAVYKKYFPALQKEYSFWMEGEHLLKQGETHRRVVKMENGTVLNRYWDDKQAPREESYYEDVQTGLTYTGNDGLVYTHLRAGAESGWDFSSRWLADTMNLSGIETTNIVPVDLNSLLYAYELILADAATAMGRVAISKTLKQKAAARKNAVLKYCWSENRQFFFDYHLVNNSTTNKWSLAGVMPLFVKMADKAQAEKVQVHIREKFLKDGGVVTTIYNTGQQWDAPNGWAPLQYVTIKGLRNYQHDSLAKQIAERWMDVNEKVYKNTGRMMEKYNVENVLLESGGGEYPSQDGFGWTNGVYLKLYEMYRK